MNSNLSRTVVAKAEAAAPYTRVCISGSKTTSEMCGNITRTNWDTTFAAAVNGDGMSHVVHHTYHVVWDNGSTTQGGDSGAPVYAVNPDGTAIAVGIHTGSAAATASDPAYGVFSSMWWSLDLTGTKIRTADRVQVGNVEGVNGTSGKVVVSGWIIDPDLVRTAASVHVYLGGPAGIGDGYSITADGFRSDVASAYPNTGSNHGFAASLTTSRRGAVPVYIYGMNLGEGEPGNPLMYSGTVYVS
ncbi:MAG: S1 family peptidase [Bifidobacteriaceae bacterium]|nr:S1 family peptidase [Bifidobacteriaceae bacterium]